MSKFMKSLAEVAQWDPNKKNEVVEDKEVLDETPADDDYDAETAKELDDAHDSDVKKTPKRRADQDKGEDKPHEPAKQVKHYSETISRMYKHHNLVEKKDEDKTEKDKKKKKPDSVKDKVETDPEMDDDQSVYAEEHEVNERELSDAEEKKKEEIVMSLKKKEGEFKKKYGDKWKDVMYATATKMAKKATSEEFHSQSWKLDEAKKFPGTYVVKFPKTSAGFGQARTAHESLSSRLNKGLEVAPLSSMTQDNEFEVEVKNQQGYMKLVQTVKNFRGSYELKESIDEGGIVKGYARSPSNKYMSKRRERANIAKAKRKEAEILKKNRSKDKNEEISETSYKDVFNAVAKYCKVDPEEIDTLDKEKKKKFFDMVDRCWDAENDRVPDSCPIDIG